MPAFCLYFPRQGQQLCATPSGFCGAGMELKAYMQLGELCPEW